jgi:endonuclease YncB( thermonuclease family)
VVALKIPPRKISEPISIRVLLADPPVYGPSHHSQHYSQLNSKGGVTVPPSKYMHSVSASPTQCCIQGLPTHSVTILDSSKTQHKIRLYGIDTLEKKQAYGQAAKRFTASLTAGKIAVVKAYDTDRYGRTLGIVKVNGKNVNQSLLEAGYAWQYRKY